jgi:glutamate-1-semialdehyde 2,1-aminomutase
MAIHPVSGPVQTPADLDHADPRWRDLLFLDLLADGYYIAARGYLALSLDITDRHVDSFVAAVADFCDRHVALA